jgi:putative peptidoglycan lipid II flippase
LGTTSLGDAYTTANTVPNVLFEVVAGGGLAVALVPLLAGHLAVGHREQAGEIASGLATWTVTALMPVAVAVAVFAGPIAGLFLPGGQDSATRELAATLLVAFAPQIPMYGIGLVLSGTLQADRRFFWPAFAPLLSSVAVIGVLTVFARLVGGGDLDPEAVPGGAVQLLGWGTTAGVAVLTLPLAWPVARAGLRLRWTFRLPPGVARRALGLAGAGMGALLAQQVSVVVVMWLANTRGGVGALPTYSYAQAIYALPYAVLAIPLVTAAFPHLVAHADRSDLRAHRATAAATNRAVLVCGAMGAAALAAVAPAVERVFTGIDRSGAVIGLADALGWFAPGLIGFALMAQLSRVLYSLGRPRQAVAWSALGWLVVAAASAVAVLVWTGSGPDSPAALRGLGAGSTIGMTTAALGLGVALRRAAGPAVLAGLARTGSVAALAAVAGAAAGRWAASAVVGIGAGGPATAALAHAPGWSAAGAGVIGALVAVSIVVAALWLADRSSPVALVRQVAGR